MIVMITMISNSPRCATKGAPVLEPNEDSAKIPMSLCESEPGNILLFLFIFFLRIKITILSKLQMVNYWLSKQD